MGPNSTSEPETSSSPSSTYLIPDRASPEGLVRLRMHATTQFAGVAQPISVRSVHLVTHYAGSECKLALADVFDHVAVCMT